MRSGSKGSFFDRLRMRFRKIKLFFIKKRKRAFEEKKLKKRQNDEKKKKDNEIILNHDRFIKRNSKGMIISTNNKFKKHYIATTLKVALVPTTIILSTFKYEKQKKPSQIKINSKTINHEKKNLTTKENIHNTYQETHKAIVTDKKTVTPSVKPITINLNTEKVKEILNDNKHDNKQDKTSTDKKTAIQEPKNIYFVEPIKTPKKNNILEQKIVTNVKTKKKTVLNIYNYKNKDKDKKVLTNVNLVHIQNINNLLDEKLKEQQKIYNDFNKKIKGIKPKELKYVKFHFLSNLFSNFKNVLFSIMSIPLLKKPKNIPLFATGLFIISNSIRNMRRLITTEEVIEYIPSNNYINAIKSNLNNFDLIEYMMEDSLDQISYLKNDYIIQFGEYSNTDIFQKNLKKINSYQEKIKNKQNQFLKEKEKMNKNLKENQKILRLIRDMNK